MSFRSRQASSSESLEPLPAPPPVRTISPISPAIDSIRGVLGGGLDTPEVKKLRKHQFVEKVFFPTWCDNCNGILVGAGWQCKGPCGRKCHRGLGKGTENCYADMLAMSCECGAQPLTAYANNLNQGYQFGDMTKQLCRNVKSKMKERIIGEAVAEQAKFGKFEWIKELAVHSRTNWDEQAAMWWVGLAQVVLLLAAQVVAYICVVIAAVPLHGSRGWELASLSASQCAMVVTFVQAGLFFGVRLGSLRLIRYSDIVHAFTLEIMHIDLFKLEVDLEAAGAALFRVSSRCTAISGVLAIAAVGNWMKEMLRIKC